MQKEAVTLKELIDSRRLKASSQLDPRKKAAQGQFMTPYTIAAYMASLFNSPTMREIRLLDAGTGVGSLTAAFVEEFCNRKPSINRITIQAYETDQLLAEYLEQTFLDCQRLAYQTGIVFDGQVIVEDFIESGVDQLFMKVNPTYQFTHAILNPPYKKINSKSLHRKLLRSIGVETVNLYTGFLAIAIKLLKPNGEMVAIVPRSFCNGPYYKHFRDLLLDSMTLKHIHVFQSRTHVFKDDDVLQENIIFHAVKGQPQQQVRLSVSLGANFAESKTREVNFDKIVNPQDPERFIHITVDKNDLYFVEMMNKFHYRLEDLNIQVSTGPVVDFRLKPYLRANPEPDTVPLIYPVHMRDHFVMWPVAGIKKPNAIKDDKAVQKWLYPNGYYALVRRFSSKEETRRVVAALHNPEVIPGDKIGFENHVNVFHYNRQGLTPALAHGLVIYLNSTLFDVCFRQFNGHTQVNVKDLYNLRYPSRVDLETLGRHAMNGTSLSQENIDRLIEGLLK